MVSLTATLSFLNTRFSSFLLFASLLTSCAKVGYLWDQGLGQISLLNSSRPNQEVLSDPSISDENKEKIRLIEDYKKYFYNYWEKKAQGIYSETTFLEGDAVTYLVIASPYNEIKAKEDCFLFMGCFPYLGFFSELKAQKHAEELEKTNWVTYVRPVYAYSTLGYFEDRILSSFFHYDNKMLAELIFHELFHTLFFIEDEIDLNEALANYFAHRMTSTYFDVSKEDFEVQKAKNGKYELLKRSFASEVKSYNEWIKKKAPESKDESETLRFNYFQKELLPKIESKCEELGLENENCFPLNRTWNHASLAAYMTYEERGEELEKLHEKLGMTLKEFFHYIEKEYSNYKKSKEKTSFTNYLLKRS